MSEETVELVLVGDVYVQRPDPDSTFAYAGKYLRAADIAFGNLETVVADPEHLDGAGHGPRTDEWMIGAYVNAGFHVMNLANNPSMYRGVKGLLRTIEVLEKAGIAYGGGGKNLQEARRPAVVERKGVKVAFVCRTSVCTIDAGATAQRAGLAVVRVATAYEAPPLLPKEVPGAPPIIHTIPNAADVEALRADMRRPKSGRMWWLFHGTGESRPLAAGKASWWATKWKWPTLPWTPALISSSATTLTSTGMLQLAR